MHVYMCALRVCVGGGEDVCRVCVCVCRVCVCVCGGGGGGDVCPCVWRCVLACVTVCV